MKSLVASLFLLLFSLGLQAQIWLPRNCFLALDIDSTAGINLLDSNAILLFPNPSSREVRLHTASPSSISEIKIYDSIGQVVYEQTQMGIDGSCRDALDVGAYYVRVLFQDGNEAVSILVLE